MLWAIIVKGLAYRLGFKQSICTINLIHIHCHGGRETHGTLQLCEGNMPGAFEQGVYGLEIGCRGLGLDSGVSQVRELVLCQLST